MSSIYLDYNSTTPVHPDVLSKMLPWFTERFGNASSKTHKYGWEAAAAVEVAREQVANFAGCEPSEIIFTSGATEAINLAIKGVYRAYINEGNHFIACTAEHKAVLDSLKDLQKTGAKVDLLNVDRDGRIDLDELRKLIREETIMVCIMMANNETGTIQDVASIGELCEEKNIVFLSDTTQAFGKIRVDVKENKFSLACLSSHKFYGPKGVGALYMSRKNPRARIHPLLTGGGHENGFRSGTLNVPGIVGMGAAAKIASDNLWDYGINTSRLRTIIEQSFELHCAGRINGYMKHRLPNTTNVLIPGIKAEQLIKLVDKVAFSTGSACTSALPEPSHVLKAMGLTDDEVYSSMRFSVGLENTQEEVLDAVKIIIDAIKKMS
jgi:cysteine desulfurase